MDWVVFMRTFGCVLIVLYLIFGIDDIIWILSSLVSRLIHHRKSGDEHLSFEIMRRTPPKMLAVTFESLCFGKEKSRLAKAGIGRSFPMKNLCSPVYTEQSVTFDMFQSWHLKATELLPCCLRQCFSHDKITVLSPEPPEPLSSQ